MKKLTLNITLLVILSIIVTSCANETPDFPDSSTTAAQTESNGVLGRESVSDMLPETDWDGREFRIIATDYLSDDFIAEEETGSLINDAVYNRNRTIEERFNVDLVADCGSDYNATNSLVVSSIMSGEDEYDLVLNHMITTAASAADNLFMDWNDVDYIDVTKPWWNYSSYENLSVDGRSYMIIGSISPYYLGEYYCVYFNKRLGLDYGIDDSIYDVVLDGKFTIDYYYSLIKDKWLDLNSNGQMDENDFYGLAAQTTSYATPFIYSFGETTVKNDADGIPRLAMNSEKFADIVNKVYQLFYESSGTLTTSGWSLHTDTFLDGRAIFFNGVFLHSYQYFTDFEDEYGILPYPKWDEAQDEYYTMSDGSSPLAAIPKTVTDTAFVGMITEALAAESWRTVIPTMYDVALKVRGVRDERSVEIIDLIANSAVVDFGFVYSDFSGMGFTLANLMEAKNKNFASFYAANKESWENRIDDIIEAYETN